MTTRAAVIDWHAYRLWRDAQPVMRDDDALQTWSAIDESERTHWRVKAARLPSEGK